MKKIYIEPQFVVVGTSLQSFILKGSVQGLGDDSGVKPGWSDNDGEDDDDPRTKERDPWNDHLW